MRINKYHVLMCWGFFIIMLVEIVLVRDASAGSFAVVVNKSNNTDNISFYDLENYFTAKRRLWPNGEKVVILLRETGSKEKKILLKKVYKRTDRELRKWWVGLVFKSRISTPPKALSSASAIIKTVAGKEGGIGIVRVEDVTYRVKVLKIDGKLPSEPGYPLVE